MGVTLYHYTSLDNAKSILRTRIIKQSSNHLPRGSGVYLTELPPTTEKEKIIFNNWDGKTYDQILEILKKQEQYVEAYFVFDSDEIGAKKQNTQMKRNEWIVRNDINLDEVNYDFDFRFDRKYFSNDQVKELYAFSAGSSVVSKPQCAWM